ncbi:MAG: V-type ATP synthase subunit D [Chromatiaceae bacterium]|jgi:V/A-type H+-transporting ATPase subunit D|nr:V-type ATP synthase subunit D [Chromatiaceae bacterium]
MTRLSLSKSSLSHEQRRLKTFERFLPSLDMKRKQLLAQRVAARTALERTGAAMVELQAKVETGLPMLSNLEVDLSGLVALEEVRVGRENQMGIWLPILEGIEMQVAPYGRLAKPHWVDSLVDELKAMIELRVREQLELRRLALLEEALRTLTQRVNLFEKVLIPRARDHIRRIGIYLSDQERAAVVRAKIAKDKRRREGLA